MIAWINKLIRIPNNNESSSNNQPRKINSSANATPNPRAKAFTNKLKLIRPPQATQGVSKREINSKASKIKDIKNPLRKPKIVIT